MMFIQHSWSRVKESVKELSPPAKMLLGSLLVIMTMSLFIVWSFAGRTSMSPLGLSSGLGAEDQTRTIDFLERHGIRYEVHGAEVWVPAERKFSLLAQLTEAQLLGADQIDFTSLLGESSPFLTRDQNRQRYLAAKMTVLGRMISQMSHIERAAVVLDQPEPVGGLGGAHVPPTASVTVRTHGGELTQDQVDAIAQLVAKAHAGMKTEDVAVIDARTGRARHARRDEGVSPERYLEVKQAAERHARTTLQGALDYISGIRIAVNAQVDATQVVQHTARYDEPKIGVTRESNTETVSTGASPTLSAGVLPNVGVNIATPEQAPGHVSDEHSETSSVAVFPRTESHITDGKGYALKINATVGVPKSYFVRLYQDRTGDQAPPSSSALATLVQAETEKIRNDVAPLIDTDAMDGAVAGTVVVSMIPEFEPERQVAGLTPPGAPLVSEETDEQWMKYLVLGGLALISLWLMAQMVRRSTWPLAHSFPSAPQAAQPSARITQTPWPGEGRPPAAGVEPSEQDQQVNRLRTMLDQITDMINRAPEDAANLIRRWMSAES